MIVHGAVPVKTIDNVVLVPEQIVLLPDTLAVARGVTVNTNVAVESQPPWVCNVAVKVPPCIKLWPFQEKGNCVAQSVIFSVVPFIVWLMVMRAVTTESHPLAVV